MAKTKKINSSKDESIELKFEFSNLKKYLPLIILGIIVVFGIYLRAYHINYPVIGYHNWKTVHYITEARNFANEGFFKNGFFIPMRDTMGNMNEPSDGAHGDTFPFTSILDGLLFRIFGESLALVRWVNILFSIGYIVFTYLLIKKLFNREDLALLTAFLTAINPLFVFFSHNVQMDTQALFFMMAGLYYYAAWHMDKKRDERFTNLYISAFCLMMSAITKYSFALVLIPIAITFPYKMFFDFKKYIKPIIICGVIAAMFPAWFFYVQFDINKNIYEANFSPTASKVSGFEGIQKSIDLRLVFDKNFWSVMKSYAADNYSIIGFWFAIFGAIIFLYLFLTKNRNEFGYIFTFGYILSGFAFLFIMGYKLNGHNYHQFPIAPYILFFIAYLFIVIARNIAIFFKEDFIKTVVIIAIVLLLLFAVPGPAKSVYAQQMAGKDRMFNTQFPGLDVAGYYIRDHSQPDERIYHSSHQSYGVLWHAERKGYKVPSKVSDFKKGEDEYNVTWAFAYQWGINTYFNSGEMFDYLKQNYRLVQFAYMQQGNGQAQPLYFLFRKGGSFNETKLNELLSNKPVMKTTYQYTSGPYELFTINLE